MEALDDIPEVRNQICKHLSLFDIRNLLKSSKDTRKKILKNLSLESYWKNRCEKLVPNTDLDHGYFLINWSYYYFEIKHHLPLLEEAPLTISLNSFRMLEYDLNGLSKVDILEKALIGNNTRLVDYLSEDRLYRKAARKIPKNKLDLMSLSNVKIVQKLANIELIQKRIKLMSSKELETVPEIVSREELTLDEDFYSEVIALERFSNVSKRARKNPLFIEWFVISFIGDTRLILDYAFAVNNIDKVKEIVLRPDFDIRSYGYKTFRYLGVICYDKEFVKELFWKDDVDRYTASKNLLRGIILGDNVTLLVEYLPLFYLDDYLKSTKVERLLRKSNCKVVRKIIELDSRYRIQPHYKLKQSNLQWQYPSGVRPLKR